MRLVFVTQTVDPASPVLGATVAKIRALAARVDELVVLADSAVPGVLPGNCRVHLFRGATRAARGGRFELALGRELARSPRPSAVLAHMCPIYAVLGAPFARPLGTRVLLWFTHWRASRTLELAERASNVVLTVERSTFPLPSEKVLAIGHGIDVARFPCIQRAAGTELRLLALGRTSPAKGLDTVVRAVALLPSVRLQIRGPSLTDEERAHRRELEGLAAELGLGDRVEIGGPVAPDDVPVLLGGADALVNNMRAGATDKVVFEAAATCLPVLASNPSFAGFLPDELRFERKEPESLAHRIGWLASADRGGIGADLRERGEREHSVDGWAEKVVAASGNGS
jgi:glycosyltransferase involved in cell wall biosynthesis